jgi:coproporphyrinogen III oxidase
MNIQIKRKKPASFSPQEGKDEAVIFFRDLRDRLCAEFEKIETELSATRYANLAAGAFSRKIWHHTNDDETPGGGGEISIMKGRVFEKVGVNISTVFGHFKNEFQAQIPGATENNGAFWASGISLVAHMQSPHVPAVHMNLRMICTTKHWLGGGCDLTPVFPNTKDEEDFHTALKDCCNRHDSEYYEEFKNWCDRYFYLPHRNEPRGIGGIFFDYIDTGDWNKDFDFSKDVGNTFLQIFPEIVRRHMNKDWTKEDRNAQLIKRGRYVEFNLLHDRGTQFGLKTGGNIEAILMSMPPEVKWE